MMRPWWRGAVVYQVYPRSYQDSNGDGVGDLPGLLGRLHHIASLGVDAVWISPFFRSPMRDFGYDVADFCDVDPLFGTLADFDAVVDRAHELGLRVLIDQVYSHTSDQHPWFEASRASRDNPKADWYVWADAKPDGTPPNNWQSVFGGPAWTWDARRGQYYLHNFLTEQPDLNLLNPAVQDALLETSRFWLERGVDGFRVDAVSHFTHDPLLRDNPPREEPGLRTRPIDFQTLLYNFDRPETLGFLERLRALLDLYTDRFALGELGGPGVGGAPDDRYLAPGRLHSAYSFLFLRADGPSTALFRDTFAQWEALHGAGWPTWVFSNHDVPRVVSRWGAKRPHPDFAAQMIALLLTLRGSVCLYQGEELGLPQADVPYERLVDPEAIANWPLTLGRDGARTPMPWTADAPQAGFSSAEPWLPLDPTHHRLAVDRQNANAASTLSITRELLHQRRRQSALVDGHIEILDAPEPLLIIERRDDASRVRAAFNLSAAPVIVRVGDGLWRRIAGAELQVADGGIAVLPAHGFLWAVPEIDPGAA